MAVRLAKGKRQLNRKARLLLLTGKLMHAGQPASPAAKISHSPVLLSHVASCITSYSTSQNVKDYSYNTATCIPPFPHPSPPPLCQNELQPLHCCVSSTCTCVQTPTVAISLS